MAGRKQIQKQPNSYYRSIREDDKNTSFDFEI